LYLLLVVLVQQVLLLIQQVWLGAPQVYQLDYLNYNQ
jgi:hypothetical protein